jgi:hypothetical protein
MEVMELLIIAKLEELGVHLELAKFDLRVAMEQMLQTPQQVEEEGLQLEPVRTELQQIIQPEEQPQLMEETVETEEQIMEMVLLDLTLEGEAEEQLEPQVTQLEVTAVTAKSLFPTLFP